MQHEKQHRKKLLGTKNNTNRDLILKTTLTSGNQSDIHKFRGSKKCAIIYWTFSHKQGKENRGSPNNNDTDFPEVYERPIHMGNRTLLFYIRYNSQIQRTNKTKSMHLPSITTNQTQNNYKEEKVETWFWKGNRIIIPWNALWGQSPWPCRLQNEQKHNTKSRIRKENRWKEMELTQVLNLHLVGFSGSLEYFTWRETERSF